MCVREWLILGNLFLRLWKVVMLETGRLGKGWGPGWGMAHWQEADAGKRESDWDSSVHQIRKEVSSLFLLETIYCVWIWWWFGEDGWDLEWMHVEQTIEYGPRKRKCWVISITSLILSQGQFCSLESFGRIWRQLWSQLESVYVCCYWLVVSRGQGQPPW